MRYEDENIWLTQKMMATLYDVGSPTINEHINFTDICRTGKCMGTDIDDDFLHPVCDNIIPFSLLGRDVYLLIYVTSDVCLVDCDMAEKCEKQ